MESLTITPLVAPQHGVRLIGELDMATVTRLKEALETVSRNGPVTLDMAELTFIDSSGLHAIMRLRSIVERQRSHDPREPISYSVSRAFRDRPALNSHPGIRIG